MADLADTEEGEEEDTLPHFEQRRFHFWLELYEDNLRDWPKDYRFKYKRGREPDVLAYLILRNQSRRSFATKIDSLVHQ